MQHYYSRRSRRAVPTGSGHEPKDRSRISAVGIAAALASVLVLVLRSAGSFVGAELAVYDRLLRRAAESISLPDPPIVMVQINEEDIREQGHWPISDRTLADAIAKLTDAGAKVIGLDLYRDLAVPPGQETFRRLLRESPSVIAVRKFGDPNTRGIPGPPVLAGSGRVGFNDVIFDTDETVRRALLFQDDGAGEIESSFALLVALRATGVSPAPDPVRPEWLRLGPTTLPPFEANDGGYVGADAAGYQLLLDFAAGESRFPAFRLAELLAGEVPVDRLAGKVVLIGSNAKSLPDLFEVPFGGRIPGVELHSHMIAQLIRHASGESAPVRIVSEWVEVGLVLFAALLGCGLTLASRGGALRGVTLLLAAALGGVAFFAATAVIAFGMGWWIPIVAPTAAWLASGGLVTTWLSSRERAQRAQLMGLFARHVSPEVAEEIWQHRSEFLYEGRPRPRRLDVSVLFVDMKGYSVQVKRMQPAQLMEWVNEFLARMAYEVERGGGVVEDYFGDGFKANFGFPFARSEQSEIVADARRAVDAALAMADGLAALNASFTERGLPRIAMRVGIDSGVVVAGSIGSEHHLKYSAVGMPVVTAQRLEATTAVAHDFDSEPCRILVSERTLRLVGDYCATEPAGIVSLKGIDEEIPTYRVLGARGEL